MKKYLLILTALFAFQIIWAQKYISKELFITSYDSVRLSGTLLMPKKEETNLTLAIIIAGSGPTDRDGNNNMMTNNSLKYLAEDLGRDGIRVNAISAGPIKTLGAAGIGEFRFML